MENQKAEQEVSALMTGMTLVGLLVPALLVWAAGQFKSLALYLVQVGVLEQSDRVIWDFADGAGLDLGRILMFTGVVLLLSVATGKTYNLFRSK